MCATRAAIRPAPIPKTRRPAKPPTAAGSTVAGVDLGNGTAALAIVSLTRSKTTAGPFSSSTQLIAADVSRLALTIVNTDTTKNLYLGLNGAAAVAGTNTVAPGAAFNLDPKYVAGQVNGLWDSGATAGASLLASTA